MDKEEKFREDIEEFWEHLKTILKPKEAFSIIYHLQEKLYLLPDAIETCTLCKELIFTESDIWEYFEDFEDWKSDMEETAKYNGIEPHLGTFNKKDECKFFCEACIDHKIYHRWDEDSTDSDKNEW